MKLPKLIGLGYRARSGKDTVGEYLQLVHKYKRVAFADRLKEVCSLITNTDATDPDFKDQITIGGIRGREFLQRVGTDLKAIDPLIWVEAANLRVRTLMPYPIVVTDVRFKAEAAHIKDLGGILIQVNRPGLEADAHISEREGAQIKWDYELDNSGDIAALHRNIRAMLPIISAQL